MWWPAAVPPTLDLSLGCALVSLIVLPTQIHRSLASLRIHTLLVRTPPPNVSLPSLHLVRGRRRLRAHPVHPILPLFTVTLPRPPSAIVPRDLCPTLSRPHLGSSALVASTRPCITTSAWTSFSICGHVHDNAATRARLTISYGTS